MLISSLLVHHSASLFFRSHQSDFQVWVHYNHLEGAHEVLQTTLVVEGFHKGCVVDQVVLDTSCNSSYEIDASVRQGLESRVSRFCPKVLRELLYDFHAQRVFVFHCHVYDVFRDNIVKVLGLAMLSVFLKNNFQVLVILLHVAVDQRNGWSCAHSLH